MIFRRTGIVALQNHINVSPWTLQVLRFSQFMLLDSITTARSSMHDFHKVIVYLTLRHLFFSISR